MADRFYQTKATTAAGTLKAAPASLQWPLEDAYITAITIIIPDGHNGLTGIRLLRSLQEIVPWSNDDWITANNEKLDIPYNDEITKRGLVVQTYNTDAFAHTHYLRAIITDTSPKPAAASASISLIPSVLLGPQLQGTGVIPGV